MRIRHHGLTLNFTSEVERAQALCRGPDGVRADSPRRELVPPVTPQLSEGLQACGIPAEELKRAYALAAASARFTIENTPTQTGKESLGACNDRMVRMGVCSPRKGSLRIHSISEGATMLQLDRITQQPEVMGGKACIRGMRVTVGMVVGQIGAGHTVDEVLADYPNLEREDIMQALRYAAWRAEEREVQLAGA